MTDHLPSHAVHADGSVSVQEAAQILGCSEKTVRRRIKAGSLAAHQFPTSQGYEWRVHLNGTVGQPLPPSAAQLNGHSDQPSGTDANGGAPAEAGELGPPSPDKSPNEALLKALDFAERLQRENMELAGRVGFLQAKLQTAEEQILALSSGEAIEPIAVPPPSAAEPTPWQRFLGWVRGQSG